MLKIAKLTDYAVLILSELARTPNQHTSATTLADVLHLTPPTVSKILKMLADSALVTSVRGAEGGYQLARAAASINLVQIIEAMEGGVVVTACCEQESLCQIKSRCTAKDNWRTINKAIKAMLSKLSILDMQQPLVLEGLLHDK